MGCCLEHPANRSQTLTSSILLQVQCRSVTKTVDYTAVVMILLLKGFIYCADFRTFVQVLHVYTVSQHTVTIQKKVIQSYPLVQVFSVQKKKPREWPHWPLIAYPASKYIFVSSLQKISLRLCPLCLLRASTASKFNYVSYVQKNKKNLRLWPLCLLRTSPPSNYEFVSYVHKIKPEGLATLSQESL